MRKQVYSDGKSRNLNLDFEIPLNNDVKITGPDGLDIPFVLAKRNKVRFTKSIPAGNINIDLEEAMPTVRPVQLDTLGLSLIRQKDIDRLNQFSQELGVKEEIIRRKELDINALAETIRALETQNAQNIDLNMASVQNSLKELYDTIIALNEQGKSTDISLSDFITQVANASEIALKSHLDDKNNPHEVSKAQVGLGNVDNTSDLDKPVSRAVQKELDKKLDKTEAELIRDEIKKSEKKVIKLHDGIANMTGGVAQLELPRGGYENQILAKASNKDGDFQWVNAGGGSIVHNDTLNRNAQNAHPISAITNLQSSLDGKQNVISDINTIRENASAGKTASETIAGYGDIVSHNASEFATSEQGEKADSALQPNDLTATSPISYSNKNISVASGYTIPTDTQVGQIETNASDISEINGKIPSQATSSNQLADKAFVNSSINSVTAYYITRNAQGDQFSTKAQLDATTVFYSGGVVRVPTRNDYCIVLADETKTDPITGENPTTRYIYQNGWEYQYTVNKTTLTANQLAALNSGITSTSVAQIETNRVDIAGKQPLLPSGTTGYYLQKTSDGVTWSEVQSAPPVDNKSISQNVSNQLQAVGVIDQNGSGNAIKTWTGTKAQYDAIVLKDNNTLYNTTDEGNALQNLLETIWPVGSYYFGETAVCPLAALFGTWQLVGTKIVVDNPSSIPVKGNGISTGFTDRNGTVYGTFWNGTYYAINLGSDFAGRPLSENTSGTRSQPANLTNIGITTDSSKSGIVADLSSVSTLTVNIWKRTA